MHILIIRFSSLGDIVLTTSTVSAIKKYLGNKVSLSYLTSSMFVPLLVNHPHIDQVYGFSRRGGLKGLFELIKLVREINCKHKIDLIIDMHGSLRSLFVRFFFFFIPRISIDKRTFERVLLTTFKINILVKNKEKNNFPKFGELLLKRNVIDLLPIFHQNKINKMNPNEAFFDDLSKFVTTASNCNQLSSTAVTFCDEKALKFSLDKWQLNILEHKKFIAIVPSASYPKKRWPAEKFYHLLEKLLQKQYSQHAHDNFDFDFLYVILAGKDDTFCDIFNPLMAKYPQQIFNLQGKCSLVESTIFLKKAFMVVGNDTGLPHIAESVGTPSIFILGPTGEEFGFYPHLKKSKMVAKKLICRPCTTNGQGFCIRKKRYCLTEISVDEVIRSMFEVSNLIKGD
ncbi:MAG: glycosyltransferase family 9 protein [Oligoflexia bacterium]|nr:glycosyltransferase family 9 protein [Oligoflexia bacterium]